MSATSLAPSIVIRPLTMLPLRIAVAAARPILCPRQFRNVRFKGSRGPPPPIIQMPAIKPQQSHRIAMQQLNELPADMGLLPDTFVMPTGENLPSLIKSPKLRLQLESRRAKQRILDWRDKLVFRFMSKTKLHLFEPKKVAVSLHHDMYTAFAQGDIETLRLICGEGLLESFKKRLMARGRNRMVWKLHEYLEPPRIVSNKAQHYAGVDLSRRQAVVRIHSLQSLTKITPNGQIMEGTNTPKEVLEYVVVEKKKSNGAESPWFVWGTTTETLANPSK